MTPPCKNCTERKPACHSTCIAYKEYDEFNKARRKQHLIDRAGIPVRTKKFNYHLPKQIRNQQKKKEIKLYDTDIH